jgi:thiamine biosynthesis lipoprotein
MGNNGAVRVVVTMILLLLAGCRQPAPSAVEGAGSSPAGRLVERAHMSMGTELRLSAWTDDEAAVVPAFDEVFREFDRLDALMSVWKEGSDVVRLNAAAGRAPVPVSADTLAVLKAARQISEWTNGKFDVTFGALSGLWRFDAQNQDNRLPDPAAVRARLPLIDYRDLVIDEPAGTAFLRRAGMSAHLGGIGKGYAVDRGVAILTARGITNFLLQAGGDLYAAGRRGDRPWNVGIRDPRGPADKSFAAIELSDSTFSTSGDYERFFIVGGRRFHHIIDPDSGEPTTHTRSVTIMAKSATQSDAIDTGVFLLGPEEGMKLIERLPDVEGVIVTAANEVLVSSGLTERLVRLAPPTDAP